MSDKVSGLAVVAWLSAWISIEHGWLLCLAAGIKCQLLHDGARLSVVSLETLASHVGRKNRLTVSDRLKSNQKSNWILVIFLRMSWQENRTEQSCNTTGSKICHKYSLQPLPSSYTHGDADVFRQRLCGLHFVGVLVYLSCNFWIPWPTNCIFGV